MKTSFYISPKPGRAMRLLWQAAGADRQLLEKSTYSDQVKYMCLGGIVLATGVMAAIAGGYAFYTIFEPRDLPVNQIKTAVNIPNESYSGTDVSTAIKASIFGVFWGLIIFNLDRFIVSSSGKGDGTEAITWEEFKGAIPRLIMGIIIALTISKPIEIRMFKTEIDCALQDTISAKQASAKKEIELKYKVDRDINEKQIGDWEKKMRQIDSIRTIFLDDARIQIKTTPGVRYMADTLQAGYKKKEYDLMKKDPIYLKMLEERGTIKTKVENEIAQKKIQISGLNGLLVRIKLAHDVAGTTISLFITLLFMAIELTPIFFKMMLIQGPYDYMSDNVKELMKAEMAIQVKHDYYKDKKGIERNLVIYHQAETLIDEKVKWAETQREVNRKAIDKWKEKQETEIDRDLSGFIKED